jgi:hypothetical protein
MTKTARRALFLVVATAANMLLTIIVAIVLGTGVILLLGAFKIKIEGAFVILLAALAGVVLSGLAYAKFLKAIRKRPDLEERFGLLK